MVDFEHAGGQILFGFVRPGVHDLQQAVGLAGAGAGAWRGISSSLLTTRLKRFVDANILTKRRYEDHPPRYEYVLTDLGRSLRPVLVVLAAWGNSRLDPVARSMVLVDADTGVEADPVVIDRATGRPLDGPDFVFTAGPAASEAFVDRYRDATRQEPAP